MRFGARATILGVLGALAPCTQAHRLGGLSIGRQASSAARALALGGAFGRAHGRLSNSAMAPVTEISPAKRARTAASMAVPAAAPVVEVEAKVVAKQRAAYTPPPYFIKKVHMDFALDADETSVTTLLNIEPASGSSGAALVLDGEELTLKAISINGSPLPSEAYEHVGNMLTIKGSALPTSPFTLETTVRNKPRLNTGLSGLYYSGAMLCTQCEAEGFRRITFFQDRPDVMAVFSVRMSGPKASMPVLLSNGNLISSGVDEARDGAGSHFAEWEDPFPKPSYLFALVAGKLEHIHDTYVTKSGRTVNLNIYSEPESVDALSYAMGALKRSMVWDEEVFGLEYDLDLFNIVAVSDFNMGAMENKGLNVFNTACVLARPWSATDGDYERVEGVVAHEYFHNWTGNRVTCRDWFQLTLKEGLTVFRDQTFSADMSSEAVKRIGDVRMLRARQFPEDASPLAHPIRPESYVAMDNFYTATVYEKGAEVIRMYATLLGKAGFRKGMDLYFQRHDGQAVTCDEFRAAMADANGKDFKQFEQWYSQPGTPTVHASWTHDTAAGKFALSLKQTAPACAGADAPPMHMPVVIALLKADGSGEVLPEQVLELTQKEQTFEFTGITAAVVPSILRGFSAPVNLLATRSDEELAFLMAHESDSFNRWEASQQLCTRVMLAMADAHAAGKPVGGAPSLLLEACRATLVESGGDQSLQALALSLPDFDSTAAAVQVVNPQALLAAISALKKDLAAKLQPELTAVYKQCATAEAASGEYSPDPASIGRRRLRDTCLAYLSSLDTPETTALCMAQLKSARCITDALSAFQSISKVSGAERLEASKLFHDIVKDDPLGLDNTVSSLSASRVSSFTRGLWRRYRWFRTRAAADVPTALTEVKELMALPSFQMTNPNRVRAVVGAFAAANYGTFHAADGSGYAFTAQCVVELDKINPQVAARLARSFSAWRRLEPKVGGLMKAQLEVLAGTAGLSRNTHEIVTTSLQ